MKRWKISVIPWRLFALLSILGMGMVSCDKRPSCESVEATATTLALATGAPIPQKAEEVEERWEGGVHAKTYISGESAGGNSSCARCHAPTDWQPLASERPQTWVAHDVPGISTPILISEQVWDHVSCEVCHAQARSEIDGEISWLEVPPLGKYTDVTSADQLCSKCHLPEVDDEHTPFNFDGVHAELLCIDCHDVHDGSATCSNSSCHQAFAQECIEIETHDKPHAGVTCGACHDGMGFAIGWNDGLQKWDTFFGGDPRVEQVARPIQSHNLILKVDCDRCHAPGDHPWDPQ